MNLAEATVQTTKEELDAFVDRLSEIVIRFDSGLTMLMDLENIYKSEKVKYLNWIPYFFFHIRNGFIRTSLIEIVNLFDKPKDAKTGIPKMLSLASSYVKNKEKNDPDVDKILKFINNSEIELTKLNDKFSTIKIYRDKFWGHLEKVYFDNPSVLPEKYPLLTSELVEFSTVAKSICKSAVLIFLKVDKEMEFIGSEELRTLIDIFADHEELRAEAASKSLKEMRIKE
jgi:hypothetical protein